MNLKWPSHILFCGPLWIKLILPHLKKLPIKLYGITSISALEANLFLAPKYLNLDYTKLATFTTVQGSLWLGENFCNRLFLPLIPSYCSVYTRCFHYIGWGHTRAFFYHSKVKFTMVNTILCVTAFCHFTIVNVHLVCRDSNGGRMKAKFTVVSWPEKAWFIMRLSKLCLCKWQLVFSLIWSILSSGNCVARVLKLRHFNTRTFLLTGFW